ncbi:MAG: hypothetical protein ACRD96_25490 [Bryobacteraceae bacterium]
MKLSIISVAVLGLAASLPAQNVISARSGLIHYVEGRALLGTEAVEVKVGVYPEVKEGQTLRTEDGRAEVLLNPGVFLRLGENSAIKMITARLSDTRVEMVSGSAVVEAAEVLADVTIVAGESTVLLRKIGVYRFDTGRLRVSNGEAEVRLGAQTLVVKQGRAVSLDGTLLVEKFDPKVGDALSRWSKRRAEYIAMAHISASKQARGMSGTWSSGWLFNPYYGMFTFVPGRGVFLSPYGYRYYCPYEVYRVYEPPVHRPIDSGMNSSVGYRTASPTSGGYSGAVAASSSSAGVSAPVSTGSAAASAPVGRESGAAGGRDR